MGDGSDTNYQDWHQVRDRETKEPLLRQTIDVSLHQRVEKTESWEKWEIFIIPEV